MDELLRTEIMIKYVKDEFERMLAKKLDLVRVSAPIIVLPETGLNDNLNGVERTVSFDASGMNVEIVQSLAKWKRNALKRYGFPVHKGLYTDMNAIRRDENLDALHSIYVDQWDWEKVISFEERKKAYLFKTVKQIYDVIKKMASKMNLKYGFNYNLPKDISFISSKDLLVMYPNLDSKERENAYLKEHKAAFIYQIGDKLKNGLPHDGRAADYDDWKLNGDIMLYHEKLGIAFEISSMGIRVDKKSLLRQLKIKNEMNKMENPYCQDILNERLPFTIGGGIGQSRLCMYYLQKRHIGEVQASIWTKEIENDAKEKNIYLL